MERDEMLELMRDAFRGSQSLCKSDLSMFGYVLDKMEDAGMLPPNDGKKRYIKPSSVPCVVEALKCHAWEVEDEEE